MKVAYIVKSIRSAGLEMIEQANEIIEEYLAQGYTLTLRQIYYQFVARGLLANEQREYNRLGNLVNDGRMLGLIDWNAIEDRTRRLEGLTHWDSPRQILNAVAGQFRYDKWKNQPWRIEVWIEKEALAGVFEAVCNELDIPFLSCRGYGSQSVMWRAAMRLRGYETRDGQRTLILHFGDHDPSGMDMTRDIEDRLFTFGSRVQVKRIALNMDQVEEYDPPPNPAKLSDTRATEYIRKFGDESWELDALNPATLSDLVREEVAQKLDQTLWDKNVGEEEEVKRGLRHIADNWESILGGKGGFFDW